MKSNIGKFYRILICLFLFGCVGFQIDPEISQIDSAISRYQSATAGVKIGDSKERVLKFLMPTQEGLPSRTIKSLEAVKKENDIVEIYYFRSGRQPDGLTTDDEFTPYIFTNGVLTAIGWTTLDGPKTYGQVIQPAPQKDLKKRVLIPAFDLDNEDKNPKKRSWKPKFFHNFPGDDSDGNELAMKVALYTSAAPTYFPVVDGYIDGGVVANNPSMAALAQTQDVRTFSSPPDLNDIVLLSIGSGMSLLRIEGKNLDWGYAQWAKPLINIMMDGVMGVAEYQCKQILGDHYCRISPLFPPPIRLYH